MKSLPDTEGDPTTEISSRLFPMSAVHGRCGERSTAIEAIAEQLAVEDDDGFALAVEVDIWPDRGRTPSDPRVTGVLSGADDR